MLRLQRLPSAEAVRVLRPLVAESGYIEALTDPNAILLTDTRANVDRILEIARAFDGESPEEATVIRFAYADAASVGQAIVEVLGTSGTGARLSVDPSSNLLLVRGTPEDIERDPRSSPPRSTWRPACAPQEAVTTTVFRMQYGDAAIVAEIIRATLGEAVRPDQRRSRPTSARPRRPRRGRRGRGAGGARPFGGGSFVPARPGARRPAAVSVQASVETNSIIVRGTAAQVAEVATLIAALDVRRPQVMIEAAIVEVSGDVAERLGVQLGFGDARAPGRASPRPPSRTAACRSRACWRRSARPPRWRSPPASPSAPSGNDFGILVQALAQSTPGAAPVHALGHHARQRARDHRGGPERAVPHRELRHRRQHRHALHHHRAARRRASP